MGEKTQTKTNQKGSPNKGGAKGSPSKGNSNNSKSTPRDNNKPKEENQQKNKENCNENQENEEDSEPGYKRGRIVRQRRSHTPRDKKKEFFKEELKRLKNSLQKESEKLVEPAKEEHKPFIFNTLEPYYNCYTQDYLFELPEELQHHYVSRNTSLGLCDPWINHQLDVAPLPKIDSTPREHEVPQTPRAADKERPAKEGSTHLPKFPSVTQTMAMPKDQNRIMPYDEVPKLREEIKNKFSSQAGAKVQEDYKRTKEDFFRMELDKMDEIHPINRSHMRRTYCAYLQNTAGSKKALYECLKTLPKEKQKKEQRPATKA